MLFISGHQFSYKITAGNDSFLYLHFVMHKFAESKEIIFSLKKIPAIKRKIPGTKKPLLLSMRSLFIPVL